jgi:hypothetical protein
MPVGTRAHGTTRDRILAHITRQGVVDVADMRLAFGPQAGRQLSDLVRRGALEFMGRGMYRVKARP